MTFNDKDRQRDNDQPGNDGRSAYRLSAVSLMEQNDEAEPHHELRGLEQHQL